MSKYLLPAFVFILLAACGRDRQEASGSSKAGDFCSEECSSKGALSCKLTTPELQQRKNKILAGLGKKIKKTEELKDGYAFQFNGEDATVDELTEFIKTERACCDFFTFSLSVSGDKNIAWLTLTGPDGTKEFIKSELGW